MKSKHIAMWTCPRSRSTAVARAFEQLDDCVVFDEPLAGAYIVATGKDKQEPEAVKICETDDKKIIKKLTGELPIGANFSFQKQMAMHALPEFGRDWLKSVNNFFLIREPKEIILSLQKIYGEKKRVTMDNIGYKALFNLYKEVENWTKEKPIVIDSLDLVKNPETTLRFICDKFDVRFDKKMLNWTANPQETNLLCTDKTGYSIWYEQVFNSTGFVFSQTQKKLNLPSQLLPIYNECMPYYEQLWNYRVVL